MSNIKEIKVILYTKAQTFEIVGPEEYDDIIKKIFYTVKNNLRWVGGEIS